MDIFSKHTSRYSRKYIDIYSLGHDREADAPLAWGAMAGCSGGLADDPADETLVVRVGVTGLQVRLEGEPGDDEKCQDSEREARRPLPSERRHRNLLLIFLNCNGKSEPFVSSGRCSRSCIFSGRFGRSRQMIPMRTAIPIPNPILTS